ncbi:TolC family protein [Chitinophaga silvisoli]|uniref:TolC family protein n=2 Tax=Chitinophaga silvisoli TaxID=2291814 RepID=A0A3E1P6F8_9BACT|nr:TolC family protein [Chitinophaga silvisoli]
MFMLSLQLLYFWNVMKLSKYPGCILAICLLFANIVATKAQDTWSLQRSVDYALANNIDIRQQSVQKRLAELTLHQSKMARIPTLNGSVNGSYASGRNVDPITNSFITTSYASYTGALSAGANIFNFFYQQNTIASNKYNYQAQDKLLEKARNDVAFNIATAFLQILLNTEQVHISEVQVKLTMDNLANTKKLVIAGSVPESNQADLEAQLATDSVTLVNAQNQVIQSTLQMKALLNLSFDQPYVPQIPDNIGEIPLPRLDEVDPEMVYSAANNNNPLIKADQLLIKSSERSYAAYRAQMYPTLSVSGQAYSGFATSAKNTEIVSIKNVSDETIGTVVTSTGTYNVTNKVYEYNTKSTTIPFKDQVSNNFKQTLGVSLNIPILNGWTYRTNAQKAKLNIESQKLTMEKDNQKLRQDIYTAHANAVSALQKYYAASRGVDASQKAYDFATKRFDLGLMNTIDYITTQSKLFNAQINKVSAQYDYIFKMKLLEFYRDQKIAL